MNDKYMCNYTADMFSASVEEVAKPDKPYAIISLVSNNPPQRDTSHAAGWCMKWQELLNAEVLKDWTANDLVRYDEVFIWNDINGSPGKLNIMGFKPDNEVGEKIKGRIAEIVRANDRGAMITQLDYYQQWHTTLTARGLVAPKWMDTIPCRTQVEIAGDRSVIGDSHSISVAPSGWAVNRNDGTTLHGALKRGLKSYMNSYEREVIFKFSDIDARHHLCRQEDKLEAMKVLLREYLSQLVAVKATGVDVSVVVPMPMTSDERKIPQSGYFKKTAWYGSLLERQELVIAMATIMIQFFPIKGIKVIQYSDSLYTEEGLLDETKMEGGIRGSSFHLAPKYYMKELS